MIGRFEMVSTIVDMLGVDVDDVDVSKLMADLVARFGLCDPRDIPPVEFWAAVDDAWREASV